MFFVALKITFLCLIRSVRCQRFKGKKSFKRKIKSNVSRRDELISEYFNHPTRDGLDGVEAAVSFLVDQENIPTPIKKKFQKILHDGRCAVSHDRIMHDGYFVRDIKASPPYNWSCPVMRARYHLIPGCKFTAVPIYDWRWTLPEAEKKQCKMPDPSPAVVAETFLTDRGLAPTRKRMHILMLGLSFMGQPYQSLACLNQKTLVDGFFMTARREKDSVPGQNISLVEITQNQGQCTGLDRHLIPSYFPNYKQYKNSPPIPQQNVYHCSTDHSALLFRNNDTQFEALVCFHYMFNPQKNIKPGAKLPCGFKWNTLDVVISLFPNSFMKNIYMPRLHAPPDNAFSTVFLSINDIYQGTLESQLRKAYQKHGFPEPTHKDLQAAPQNCKLRDVHYALPGFTDHAVTIWFSLLASGLYNSSSKNEEARQVGPTFIGRWRSDNK